MVDRVISTAFVNNHDYERLFRVEKNDVVVDVGAHVGIFSLSVAAKAKKVIAIECEPRNLTRLSGNIKRLNLNNVLIVDKAVWNCKSTLPLHLSNDSESHTLIEDWAITQSKCNPSVDYRGQIQVKTDTLDGILDDLGIVKIDFLKMDVEGAEIEAIEGAKETLTNTSKIAIACYHERNGEKTMQKTIQMLSNYGYQLYSLDGIVYGTKLG